LRGSDILFVQYRLYQSRVETSDASQERLDLARSARRSHVVKVVTGLYFALWFAPFWIPAAVALYLVYRWVRREIRRLVEQWRARRLARRENPPA